MNAENDKQVFSSMLFSASLKTVVSPTGKLDEAQDQNAKEKSLETKLPMDTATKTERQLLPYDPNKPVGTVIITFPCF